MCLENVQVALQTPAMVLLEMGTDQDTACKRDLVR